jgi:hypothetical protein
MWNMIVYILVYGYSYWRKFLPKLLKLSELSSAGITPLTVSLFERFGGTFYLHVFELGSGSYMV